ncbi:hypothetical protein GCM10023226_34520 [Nocardioides nanhaiensis]|uniref:Helix-hairpin-helix DNA-binding motif class 1 domain-containing protein n=1 Tax=Nocardioides nanhaiensis TaxID=1476871 RepID=A0ABP8WQF0_9ACTN
MARRLASLTAELEQARAAAGTGSATGSEESGGPAEQGDWWGEHTRVAPALRLVSPVPAQATVPTPVPTPVPAPSPMPAPPAVEEPAPVLPVPGRHAARREAARSTSWADRVGVPEPLRGRVHLGSAHVSVVAVLVALGAVVTAWLVVRGDAQPAPVPVAAPAGSQPLVPLDPSVSAPGAAATPGAPVASSGAAATGSGDTVTVDVAGRVRRPGIAVLPVGARVVDALEAAGGARPGVDLSSLNLARPLVDGEQVLVGGPAPASAAPPVPGTATTSPPATGAVGLVNLNTATPEQLEALPQVGPVTASAIVAWREANGAFASVDQLVEVDGIGEATLAQIAPYATV